MTLSQEDSHSRGLSHSSHLVTLSQVGQLSEALQHHFPKYLLFSSLYLSVKKGCFALPGLNSDFLSTLKASSRNSPGADARVQLTPFFNAVLPVPLF